MKKHTNKYFIKYLLILLITTFIEFVVSFFEFHFQSAPMNFKELGILFLGFNVFAVFIIAQIHIFGFGVETFSFLTPFKSINDNLPFGYMLPSFFFPVLIYACAVSFIYLIYCIIKKTEPVHYLLSIIPFASIISGIIFSVFILFVVGMYSIIFKGEFM